MVIVNADVSQITSMSEATRKAEMLQKKTEQYIKCYTSSNYRHGRIKTQSFLVTTYDLDIAQKGTTAEMLNKITQ